MSSRSQALSKPETIIYDNNIFQKEIRQTGNNYDTTCLDLAMKKLPLNNYISDLGQYNLVNFENNYTPAKTHYYTYTDYSQQCPSGWSNQGGGQTVIKEKTIVEKPVKEEKSESEDAPW